jgi:ABC-type sugar transport system ATPase subunit
MNVFDNLAFPLKLRKIPRPEIDGRVRRTAETLGIEHFLKRKPHELSGGERQRVALGRALVREPEVFLLDEPLSNLDAKLRVYMRAEIKKLHHDLKITFVYVTHDQAEALTMADMVAVMDKGTLQQYDLPHGIYVNPANQFVATFVGSPAMNIIRGKMGKSGGRICVDFPVGRIEISKVTASAIECKSEHVALGFRPEDVKLTRKPLTPSALKANVYAVEPLGSDTYVTLLIPETKSKVIARTVPDIDFKVGEFVFIEIATDRICLFDQYGSRLL